VTDAFPFDEAPRHLFRERDGAFGPVYTRRIRAMGIRDRSVAPRSPWQNGHVERLIGSIRRESLDHLVVFGEAPLRYILKNYASYYNKVRPHLSLWIKMLLTFGGRRRWEASQRFQSLVGCIINTSEFRF
jgi:transposase InsO family protein